MAATADRGGVFRWPHSLTSQSKGRGASAEVKAGTIKHVIEPLHKKPPSDCAGTVPSSLPSQSNAESAPSTAVKADTIKHIDVPGVEPAPSKRAQFHAEPARFNHFVLRDDAVARDDECVKALEAALLKVKGA